VHFIFVSDGWRQTIKIFIFVSDGWRQTIKICTLTDEQKQKNKIKEKKRKRDTSLESLLMSKAGHLRKRAPNRIAMQKC
jgi:hypothetical protein